MKTKIITILAACVLTLATHAGNAIDLSGEWEFMIDRSNSGEQNGWYNPTFQFNDKILLPGSMPQRMKGDDPSVRTPWVGAIYDSSYYHNPYMEKYRKEGEMKIPFFLTPSKHYVGKAWYKKTFTIEKLQANTYELFLERPHIVSKVWVNGKAVIGENNNSLSVPHKFSVLPETLKEGENTIVICVDNDPETVKVGQDSHSVTDQTQGCWNGIVGKMELRPFRYMDYMRVYPDVDNRKVHVKVSCGSWSNDGEQLTVTLIAESFNTATRHIVASKPVSFDVSGDACNGFEADLDMGDEMLLWDEFTPNMYRLTAEIEVRAYKKHKLQKNVICKEYAETYFGMRKMEIRDKMFYINGKQILLRGNVDSCLFPDTGYPPTDLDSWIKIFEKQKAWGINHVRFHSYCPPENAFLAADIVGIYIQPEGPSWPNHGVRLGRKEPIDTYLWEESMRICDEYGNHPSFTFFAFGNEPAGNWVAWCNEHMDKIKAYDPRHIYAGFSVGGGWAWQPKTEFAVKAGARGLAEWVNRAPESMADFSEKITTYNGKDMPGTPITIPFVTHEMGQWCVFPNFAEIEKYKGVNKAKNFEIFRDLLRDNGMESRGNAFLMASGKLQALCYKYETERILRTPKYAGYQLLALNDYSGQGSALVGVTDVFFDAKGYITAPEYREFNSRIVPLAKFPKFTYSNTETFEADIELAQFSGDTLKDVTPRWTIEKETADTKVIFAEGNLTKQTLPIGQNLALGKVNVSLADAGIEEAAKYTLTVTLPGTEARNHWDFWVYPQQMENGKWKIEKDIYITDSLDAKAQKVLKKGGKVLICAAGKVTYGREVKQQFLPVFWNTSWFKMRPPHTTGLFIEHKHPVFSCFPTDYHSDLQWWELANKAQVMQFTDFPKDFQPLVQSIDTWFVSRKIGMLFEANVGKGKLIMTTMDISSDLDKRLAARQMRQSILRYMASDSFQPQWTIDKQCIADLFTKVAGEVNMYTNDSPDELKPKLK